jgi:hypothetical protein
MGWGYRNKRDNEMELKEKISRLKDKIGKEKHKSKRVILESELGNVVRKYVTMMESKKMR